MYYWNLSWNMKTQHPLPPHLTPVLVSGIGAQIIYKIGGGSILQPYQNVRVYVGGFFLYGQAQNCGKSTLEWMGTSICYGDIVFFTGKFNRMHVCQIWLLKNFIFLEHY